MRFHMGVSFSWRTIKKFLFPILIGLLAFFGFNFIYDNNIPLGFLRVNALTNYDTEYDITLFDWDTYLSSYQCADKTLKQEIDDFIDDTDFDSAYFDFTLFKTYNGDTLYFMLIPKTNRNYNLKQYYVQNNVGSYSSYFRYDFTRTYTNDTMMKYFQMYIPNYCSSSSTFTTSNGWASFLNALNNNIIDSNNNGWRTDGSWSMPNFGVIRTNLNFSVDNNNSYSFVDNWFYYSTFDFTINTDNQLNDYYFKKIHLTDNNTYYSLNDTLPSYYDLHHSSSPVEPSFIGYKTSLDTFYTSIPVNNINNYQLKFKFDVPQSLLGYYQTPQEYIDNTSFNYICGGRVDHTNYYTYENFNCSLTSSYTNTDSSIEYTFNNFSTSQSLSNYDKIYITINTNYLDTNISTTIYNLSYTYNLGDFYNTEYKGFIYENLSNLPLNFRVYLSSNNSINNSTLYVRKSNFINYNVKYIGFSNTSQQQNLVIGSSILGNTNNGENVDFISTQVSNNIDTGIMIYQQNSAIPVPSLEMFFNGGIVISINNNLSSNSFYYIDNEGNIQNNNFSIPIQNIDNTNYDISYYIGVVNSFIDDLSDDSVEFSYLTQSFYNSLPMFFQTFLFVVFILICVYFTYLLIKR